MGDRASSGWTQCLPSTGPLGSPSAWGTCWFCLDLALPVSYSLLPAGCWSPLFPDLLCSSLTALLHPGLRRILEHASQVFAQVVPVAGSWEMGYCLSGLSFPICTEGLGSSPPTLLKISGTSFLLLLCVCVGGNSRCSGAMVTGGGL